jgi:hypothetical protein
MRTLENMLVDKVTEVTVTLDGARLARARAAAEHVSPLLFVDRDPAAFVADLARVSPLALAAWLSGRASLRFVPESDAAREEADADATRRTIARNTSPVTPAVRVVLVGGAS